MITPRHHRWVLRVLALLVFAVPLVHSGTVADPFGLPRSLLLAAGGLAIVGLGGLALGRGRTPPRLTLAATLALVILVSAAVAALLSVNRGLAVRGLVDLAALVVLGAATALTAKTPRDAALLFDAALLSSAVVALGDVAQVFQPGLSLSLGGFSILPPVPAGSYLGDPGLAAQHLLIAAPLALGAAFLARGVARLACGLGIGIVIAALLYAGRPEGWIAAAGVAALLAALGAARTVRLGGWARLLPDLAGSAVRTFLVAVTSLLVVAALARIPALTAGGVPAVPLAHVGLLAPTSGDPHADRIAAVRGTVSLIALHPLGVGPSNWRHAFLEVAWTRVPGSPFTLTHQAVHAGNSFLEMAAEDGPAAAVAFAALLFALVWGAARIAVCDPGEWGGVGLASAVALLAGVVAAFFGSPLQEHAPALLLAVSCGLAWAAARGAARPVGTDSAAGAPSGGAPDRRADRFGSWVRGAAFVVWAGAAVWCGSWYLTRWRAGVETAAGQSILNGGDAAAALRWLSARSAVGSADHLPHALLGNAALRAGRPDVAIDAFTRTLERSPFFVSARLGRASAYETLGRYDLADGDLQAALAVWPGNSDTWMARGRLDAHRGRLDRAIEDYRQAAAINPALADPLCAVAEAFTRQERWDEAIESYRACGEKNPRYPNLNLDLGLCFEKKGLYDMSVHYYQRAAGLDERAVEPRLRLANALDALGRHCEAQTSLEAARDLETDPDRRATVLRLIDQVDPACRREKAAGRHP